MTMSAAMCLLAAVPDVVHAQSNAQNSTPSSAQSNAQSMLVVVNSANPIVSLTKDQLALIYLKKTKKWKNDEPIVPVDQARRTKLRDTFSLEVLGRSASTMETYWQAQIFSGKDVPPLVRKTDADVLAYVRETPGAIGYVMPGTSLETGVKTVTVKD